MEDAGRALVKYGMFVFILAPILPIILIYLRMAGRPNREPNNDVRALSATMLKKTTCQDEQHIITAVTELLDYALSYGRSEFGRMTVFSSMHHTNTPPALRPRHAIKNATALSDELHNPR